MTPTFMTRRTQLFVRALPLTALSTYLLLNGCIPITERLTEGPAFKQEETILEHGSLQVQVLPHPDSQGWTVSFSQPILREIEEIRHITAVRRYYYFQPLALPAGLFACPTSAWAWAWNLLTPTASPEMRRNLMHYTVEACLLALIIARSDRQSTVESTVLSKRLEPDTITAREGHITVRWNGPKQVDLSYPIDEDGRAVIRLTHLATAIQNAGYDMPNIPAVTVSLSVWHKNQLQSNRPLEITATAIQAVGRHQVPATAGTERWPRPLVMTVRFQGNASKVLGIEDYLSRIALRHHVPLITSEEIRPLLRQELEHIMSGGTEDQTAVSPGHWLAPTVLLTVRAEETTTGSVLSLQCHNIHTGELLAHIATPAGPNGLGLAKDVALARLDDVLGAIIGRGHNSPDGFQQESSHQTSSHRPPGPQ